MKPSTIGASIGLVALAALLALPIAQTASPVEAKTRLRTVTRTFRNATALNLPVSATLPVSASLYPSPIVVRGLRGPLRDVNVTLRNFTHANAADVQALLVGPDGQTAVLMADTGEETANNGAITLRLDDEAAEPIPDAILPSGTYRPTNHNDTIIAFNRPAPTADAGSALSVFDGSDPNGTWRLFVQDAFMENDTGAFTGGWNLEITAKARKKR